jgi:hypothetical protein
VALVLTPGNNEVEVEEVKEVEEVEDDDADDEDERSTIPSAALDVEVKSLSALGSIVSCSSVGIVYY